MNKLKILLLLLILVQAKAPAQKQSVDWLVKPEYSNMKYFGPDMYKITKDGKVGIMSTRGDIILRPEYDAINLFYEGRAVFVNKTQKGWKVEGVLTEEDSVYYTRGDYYLLNSYMFYSEGFLPVSDGNGRYGYLDEECRQAFPFTTDQVRPFSEGFAAVGSKETFHWINTDGEQILPRLRNGGTPYGGTNFYNGKAYLWDEDGVFFVLDDDGHTTKIKQPDLDVDYLYRVGSGKGDKVEYTTYEPDYSSKYTPKENDGQWTYASDDGSLLSPYKYDVAEGFIDDAAIASADGMYGLLHVVTTRCTKNGRTVNYTNFATWPTRRRLVYSAGSSCRCEFSLAVPQKWSDKPISVILKDPATGKEISIRKSGRNKYAFSYRPGAGQKKTSKNFRVEVSSNGAQIWQGNESFTFVQRARLSSGIRVNNADANAGNRCFVTAWIKNPSPIAVTTTVTLSGGGSKSSFNNVTKTVTIPPYGSRSITSSFLVKKVELKGWCAVSTTDGTSARKVNLQLKPF